MKLTPHQKKIVKEIVAGRVYDIPSYLKVFEKGHEQKYDPAKIQDTFDKVEIGKTYLFREESSYYYTDIYDQEGAVFKSFRVPNTSTYEFKDYPLSVPIKAEIKMKIKPETIDFCGRNYTFNFLDRGYFVADDFNDIKDFIALWSYLKREALVIEVQKPVETDDLSVFFELMPQKVSSDNNPCWCTLYEEVSDTENEAIPKLNVSFLPYQDAQNYIEHAWKMNEEHLTMCDEFIGRKLLTTSSLKIYSQSKYRTVEERSIRSNLIVAWVAVAISVISVILGNIIPMLGVQETDYLGSINQQVASIEAHIKNDTDNQEIIAELSEIKFALVNISKSIEHSETENLSYTLYTLSKQIEELNKLLSEQISSLSVTE